MSRVGRFTDEERREKARNVLVETIAKIADLEPVLGGKWRSGMLDYYSHRLAELVLYQSGFEHPSREAVEAIRIRIYDLISEGIESV